MISSSGVPVRTFPQMNFISIWQIKYVVFLSCHYRIVRPTVFPNASYGHMIFGNYHRPRQTHRERGVCCRSQSQENSVSMHHVSIFSLIGQLSSVDWLTVRCAFWDPNSSRSSMVTRLHCYTGTSIAERELVSVGSLNTSFPNMPALQAL